MTNTNLRTIEILIGSNTTGENTHEENLLYINALRSALEAEYPSANISVEMSRNDCTTCRANGFDLMDVDDVEEKINLITNRVWEGTLY